MFSMQLNKSLIWQSYVICKSPIFCQLCYKTKKASIKLNFLKLNRKNIKQSLNVTNKIIYGPILKKSQENVCKKDLPEHKEYVNIAPRSYPAPHLDGVIDKKKKGEYIVELPSKREDGNLNSLQKTVKVNESKKIGVDSYEKEILPKHDSEKLSKVVLLTTENLNLKYMLPSEINIEEVKRFPLLNLSRKERTTAEENNEISSISIFEGGYKKLPSVRNILEKTMPPERKLILKKWENNMIDKLGDEGFQNYRQGLLDRGKIIHECIELKLRNIDIANEQLVGIEHYWTSINKVFQNIQHVRLLESRVIHPSLHYQGCIDCLGMYKNIPVLIEFKTSTKPKLTLSSTYDDPLQLAAYIGALNHDNSYDFSNVDNALLVIAYSTGLPAHVHVLPTEKCQKYWNQWCQRLSQFFSMHIDERS